MINQQSAASSTSSRKKHKIICQLRTSTTALFAVDRGKRPKQQRRQRHHSNNKAPLSHRLYCSIEYSRGKEPPNDAIPGRMHTTGFFRGYRLLLTIRDLRVAQLNNRNDFPPFFLCRKVIHCFLVHPLPVAISQTKSVCVIEPISVCALTRIYITCKITNYADVPELPASRPGMQPLVMLLCGFSWRSNRNHYLLVLVMRALDMSIHVHVRTYRHSIMKCTTINTMISYLPRYHRYYFYSKYYFEVFVLGQNMTPI